MSTSPRHPTDPESTEPTGCPAHGGPHGSVADDGESTRSATAVDPPWVPGIPLLGNTFQVARDASGFFVDSYKRHGPIFKVSVFFNEYTVLVGNEALAFYLKEKESHLSRTSVYRRFAEELGTGHFILGEPPDRHQHLRGQMRLGFSRQVASRYIAEMIESVDTALDAEPPGSRVTAMDFVARIAFDQYSRVMCGRSLSARYDEASLFARRIMNVGAKIWPDFTLSSPGYKRAKAAVFQMMDELMAEYRARAEDAPSRPFTVMDALLAARADEGGEIPENELVACALYGFVGTLVYMNRAISFLLYDLLKDPALLERVTEEVDAMYAHGAPDSLTLRGLRLLPAAFKESLRLHPIALGLPFMVEEDFEFEGHRVRKGDYCILSGVTGHFSEEFYSCPHQFDPERCLPPRNEHKPRGAYVPFGFAARTCAAVGLVETITLCTVSRMLYRRELSVSPENHRLRTVLGPLPGPSNGFRIRLGREREQVATAGAESRLDLAAHALEKMVGRNALEAPGLRECITSARPQRYAKDDSIIRQGQPAKFFYILVEGEVEVHQDGIDTPLALLGPGDYFGERGLLGGGIRTAHCRARTDALVLRLTRDRFLQIVREHDLVPGEIAGATRRRYLSDTINQALPDIESEDLGEFISDGSVESHAAGARIFRQGDFAESFYILLRGTVVALNETAAGEEPLRTMESGDFFGEIGILESKPRTATVRVSEDGPAQVLALPRDTLLTHVQASPRARADIASVMASRLLVKLSTR